MRAVALGADCHRYLLHNGVAIDAGAMRAVAPGVLRLILPILLSSDLCRRDAPRGAQQRLLHQDLVLERPVGRLLAAQHAREGLELALVGALA